MVAKEPKEPASNWDFTPVYDLLSSSDHNGLCDLSKRSPSATASLPLACPEEVSDIQRSSRNAASQPTPPPKSHGLGDFGSLVWESISQAPENLQDKDSKCLAVPDRNDHQPNISLHSPITILKRCPQDISSKNTITCEPLVSSNLDSTSSSLKNKLVSRTDLDSSSHIPPQKRSGWSPDPILKATSANPPHKRAGWSPKRILKATSGNGTVPQPSQQTSSEKPKIMPKVPGAVKVRNSNLSETREPKVKFEAMSSEGSAEVDSDLNTQVFDRPVGRKSNHLSFVPGQVGTPETHHGPYETPPSSFDEKDLTLSSEKVKNIITTSAGIKVLPAEYKTATDRRIGLMSKLLREFPEYAQLVSQIGRPPSVSSQDAPSRPIHVFVDMSNIMVGFHDSVKVSRDIPISTRIRRLHISFANFALIMERGRSAAKRVLVGSDRLPSIEEAKTLGYETNILERVHKTKNATPRSSKFRKTPENTSHLEKGGPGTVGVSNERWVEQGVDEILHLKILESLLDTDEPATIVLATGDAAAAEFSEGFMRMIDRGLRRGWKVELVSFSQVTSYSYRKKEFREQWGDNFQLIELDSYVEELFE